MAVTIGSAQRLFSPEGAYLDTVTYGLPPRTAFSRRHGGRGGALRLSCHLYTTERDVDRALEALSR